MITNSVQIINANKNALRKVILPKEKSLQNESETEIFGIKTSDLFEQYIHEDIIYVPTDEKGAEILVLKGAKVTAELRNLIYKK